MDFLQWVWVWFGSYLAVSWGPVIPGPAPVLGQVDVLWVVQVGVRWVHDCVDDSRLQIQQNSSWDVVLIICLQSEQHYNNESNIVMSPSGFVVNIMHCDIFKLYFCFFVFSIKLCKIFLFGFRIRVFMDLIFQIVVVFSETFCDNPYIFNKHFWCYH